MPKATDPKNCIVCGDALTPENWTAAARKNYVNKCAACLGVEKNQFSKQWRKKNPQTVRDRSKKYKANLRATDPVKSRAREAYGDARKRALKNGMPFNLTSQFVLNLMRQVTECPYFGWRLTHLPGKHQTLASLDRVDSSKGYTMDNVRIISYQANLMKSDATMEQLIAFARGVLKGAEGNR